MNLSRKPFLNLIGAALLALAAATTTSMRAQEADSDTSVAIKHNTWSLGRPMPTPSEWPFTGAIGKKIYVAGGSNDTSILASTQIYDTATNSWSKGKPMLTPRCAGASAVVNNVLYTIGGDIGNNQGNLQSSVVEAYNPTTNEWSTKKPIPVETGIDNLVAVADGDMIYVIGGYVRNEGREKTVYAYNTAENKWTKVASMKVGKSYPAVGLIGTTILAAGGLEDGGVTNDNEGYNVSKKSWAELDPIPTGRQAGCYGVVEGVFYYAGGAILNGQPLPLLEAYFPKTNSWTSQLALLPRGTINPSSASVDGRLYCFGGSNSGYPFSGSIYNYVQIYQP